MSSSHQATRNGLTSGQRSSHTMKGGKDISELCRNICLENKKKQKENHQESDIPYTILLLPNDYIFNAQNKA